MSNEKEPCKPPRGRCAEEREYREREANLRREKKIENTINEQREGRVKKKFSIIEDNALFASRKSNIPKGKVRNFVNFVWSKFRILE